MIKIGNNKVIPVGLAKVLFGSNIVWKPSGSSLITTETRTNFTSPEYLASANQGTAAYLNGQYILAFTTVGKLFFKLTTDGTNFTEIESDSGLYSGTVNIGGLGYYGGNYYIALGNKVLKSSNLANWTEVSIPYTPYNYNLKLVSGGGKLLVYINTEAYPNNHILSYNGTSWTEIDNSTGANMVEYGDDGYFYGFWSDGIYTGNGTGSFNRRSTVPQVDWSHVTVPGKGMYSWRSLDAGSTLVNVKGTSATSTTFTPPSNFNSVVGILNGTIYQFYSATSTASNRKIYYSQDDMSTWTQLPLTVGLTNRKNYVVSGPNGIFIAQFSSSSSKSMSAYFYK